MILVCARTEVGKEFLLEHIGYCSSVSIISGVHSSTMLEVKKVIEILVISAYMCLLYFVWGE